MTSPPSATFLIAHAKLVDYLLNVDHVDGASKARFFLGFGFRRDRPDQLADPLIDHAHAGWPGVVSPGRLAAFNVVVGPVRTPVGRSPWVCAVWNASLIVGEAWLVTAYPRSEPSLS